MANQGEIIRDMAEQLLREAGEPMHAGDLADAIRKRVGSDLNITQKNVYGYLWDAPTRFTKVGRAVFTLAD